LNIAIKASQPCFLSSGHKSVSENVTESYKKLSKSVPKFIVTLTKQAKLLEVFGQNLSLNFSTLLAIDLFTGKQIREEK
jgi:hypothetical protein